MSGMGAKVLSEAKGQFFAFSDIVKKMSQVLPHYVYQTSHFTENRFET